MKRTPRRIRSFWVWINVILLSLLPVAVNSDSAQCDNPRVSVTPLAAYEVYKDRGGLSAMCEAASSMRYDIIKDEFPYEFAREQAKLWHDTGAIDSGLVKDSAMYYLRDMLYLTSFFVFLGIGIPVMASIFWYLWQHCDEDDQDDEMKNASYQEQVFAWVLGVGLLLCCISMIVFVSLLLVGSSLAKSGSTDSTDAAVATIPQAMTLRNNTINAINLSLVTEMIELLDSYNISFSRFNCTSIPAIEIFNKMDAAFNSSSQLHGLLSELWAKVPGETGSGSLTIPTALLKVQASLDSLNQACTSEDLPTNLTRSCDKLPKGITLPDEISDDNVNKSMSLLGQLKNATAGSLQLVDDNRRAFNACQNSTVASLVGQVNDVYSSFEEEVINETIQEVNDMLLPLRRLHLGLPQSQEQVEEFSDAYLVQGIELFYSRSLLFSIIILFLLLGICFAVARGSYNIYYIYLCGNDPLFVRRAHQAGMILKKLAYCFYVVCFATTIGMSLLMCTAGVIGGSCGEKRNFTEIMARVIDNEKTWEGEYPLAQMVLGNPYYCLVYQDVLTGCSHGDNIYTVLDLEQNNYSVFNYHPITNTLSNFTNKMSKVLIEPCRLLDNNLYTQLVLLDNTTLEISTLLTIWRNYVGQLEISSEELANLSSVLSEMGKELSNSFNDSTVDSLAVLVQELVTDLHTSLQLLNASLMTNLLDDITTKISEQNITALLLLLKRDNFTNTPIIKCYDEASKLWDDYNHRPYYSKHYGRGSVLTITLRTQP